MRLNEILDVCRRSDYMSLALKERKVVVRKVSKRYKKVRKEEKEQHREKFRIKREILHFVQNDCAGLSL